MAGNGGISLLGSESLSLPDSSVTMGDQGEEQIGKSPALLMPTGSTSGGPHEQALLREETSRSTRITRRSRNLKRDARVPAASGMASLKIAALIAAVSMLLFLRGYFLRCIAPSVPLRSAPFSRFVSPSSFSQASSLPGALLEGSSVSAAAWTRRLSAGEPTPPHPSCDGGSTDKEGKETDGSQRGKKRKIPTDGDPAGSSSATSGEATRKKRARGGRRGAARPEAPEEEIEDQPPTKSGHPLPERMKESGETLPTHPSSLQLSEDQHPLIVDRMTKEATQRKILLKSLTARFLKGYEYQWSLLRHAVFNTLLVARMNSFLRSHGIHPVTGSRGTAFGRKMWRAATELRLEVLNAMHVLEANTAPRSGIEAILLFAAERSVGSVSNILGVLQPAPTATDVAQAVSRRMQSYITRASVTHAFRSWFSAHPNTRQSILVDGGMLENLIFGAPRTYVPEATLREWTAARENAAATSIRVLRYYAASWQADPQGDAVPDRLLRALLQADFGSAVSAYLAPEEVATWRDDIQSGAPEASYPVPTGDGDDDMEHADKAEEPLEPGESLFLEDDENLTELGTGEGANLGSSFRQQLESLSAGVWARWGLHGPRSETVREAFLSAALTKMEKELKQTMQRSRGDPPLQQLEALEKAFVIETQMMDVIGLARGVLQRNPELQELFTSDSEFLQVLSTNAIEGMYVDEPPDPGSDSDDNGDSMSSVDSVQGPVLQHDRLPTPEFEEAFRDLFEQIQPSDRAALNQVLRYQKETLFPRNAEIFDSVCRMYMQYPKSANILNALLLHTSVLEFTSLQLLFLGNHHNFESKKSAVLLRECTAKKNLTEELITRAAIMITGQPASVGALRHMLQDMLVEVVSGHTQRLTAEFNQDEGDLPTRQALLFQRVRQIVSSADLVGFVARWLETHPQVTHNLPPNGQLFFIIPSLMPWQRGRDPFLPGSADRSRPQKKYHILFAAGDFAQLSPVVQHYCFPEDYPPEDPHERENWTSVVGNILQNIRTAVVRFTTGFSEAPVERTGTLLRRVLRLDMELARVHHLTRTHPELLDRGSPLHKVYDASVRTSVAAWERMGIFEPVATAVRSELLAFLLQSKNSKVKPALVLKIPELFSYRITQQRSDVHRSLSTVPLLQYLHRWMEARPDIANSPWIASDSSLVAAVQALGAELVADTVFVHPESTVTESPLHLSSSLVPDYGGSLTFMRICCDSTQAPHPGSSFLATPKDCCRPFTDAPASSCAPSSLAPVAAESPDRIPLDDALAIFGLTDTEPADAATSDPAGDDAAESPDRIPLDDALAMFGLTDTEPADAATSAPAGDDAAESPDRIPLDDALAMFGLTDTEPADAATSDPAGDDDSSDRISLDAALSLLGLSAGVMPEDDSAGRPRADDGHDGESSLGRHPIPRPAHPPSSRPELENVALILVAKPPR
ncbi:hypothetical protein BESB_046870 [Besnoitia besnoiti]|uniref:Transmembrane protein n=1 Tax=Besnoitia besnoiti TaxID=94643 RepID=A0A2A9MES9_BESBE|nr:hypothetical protein BESB_046870 [Besnoitia besnoiti]PFH36495.1 hypothetical protein BESB_046870 [Besnoitia besnoiti]